MKVCERCGNENYGRDGINTCLDCRKKKISAKKSRQNRKAMDDVMSSLGLTKVKGALGGTYWE